MAISPDLAAAIRSMAVAVQTYFSDTAAMYGPAPAGVGWSARSQAKRFVQLLKIGELGGSTLLDVGCGYGDFYRFLRERGIHLHYTGFDLTPSMIEIARRKNPEVADRFSLVDILTEDVPTRFDYVVANGPLNVAHGDNPTVMLELIRRMHDLAGRGLAVTMTSNRTPNPKTGIYYYDPAHVLDRVREFCPTAVLDHSYLPHDFTIFGYRTGPED